MERSERYEGLDHLRGLLALTVMIYHYLHHHGLELHWTLQRPLELLGLYAVSTFYVLSGCALFIVYQRRNVDGAFLVEFFIKRAFRIVPLFWLATASALALSAVMTPDFRQSFDVWRAFLNFSLLFSWLDPTAYYAPGAWSIGNEWFFYALFPVMLWASRARFGLAILSAATLCIAAAFAFYWLAPQETVQDQWSTYVNPLNQLPLFLGGFWVGRFVVGAPRGQRIPTWLYLALALFALIAYTATRGESVTGLLRFGLIGVCGLWCWGFGVTEPRANRLGSVLGWLGAVSYTVYLMHPLVHTVVNVCAHKANSLAGASALASTALSWLVVLVSMALTLAVSHSVYRALEVPALRMGRALAERARNADACSRTPRHGQRSALP